MRCLLGVWFLGLPAVALATSDRLAGQWPQWGGPDRDFRAVATAELARSWETRQPERLWDRPLGNGTAGIALASGRLFTMSGEGKRERVIALDPKNGKTLWDHEYDVRYEAQPKYGGPHATPLVAGDRVFAVGIDAKLHAFDLDGKLLWKRDLVAEHRVDLPQSGYAASPVAWQDTIIVAGSGAPSRAAFAFRQSDGALVWARHSYLSSHASPILIRTGGADQVVFHGINFLFALDPGDGRLLWRARVRRDAIDNVAWSPVWIPERKLMIVSQAYDRSGTQAFRIDREGETWKVERAWASRRLKVEHCNGVVCGGLLLASDGSEPAFTVGLDVATGRPRFKARGLPKANFVVAGGLLVILDEDGVLHLAEPGERELRLLGKREALRSNAWTAPTLVGGVLYVRDRFRIQAWRLP